MNQLHDLAGRALDTLLQLTVLLSEDMTKSLAAEGLSVARAHVMWHVHHHGPVTQRALADALKVTPRNVTGLVDGLVAGGHATREPHPADRRATLVSLTERGAATMAAMEQGHRELAALLFGDMAGPELEAFAAGLAGVTERLREALEQEGR